VFDSQQGQEILLYSRAFRPSLGPTQHLFQWASGSLSPKVKRKVCEADHSLPSVPNSRMVELYLHSPVRLHGLVLD
jgi:hypothetical protein